MTTSPSEVIRFTVASASQPQTYYEVVGDVLEDELGQQSAQFHCECPGCTFRGRCRHTAMVQKWLLDGLRNMEITE